MANRTVKYARSVHGTNPQYLIEKIIRERIYDAKYWQDDCFMITSAIILEKAVDDLKYIGGTFGAKIDPTPFLCLVLKLLQIQPEKEIIYLYIEQTDFKYLRALGAFYLRLVGSSVEVYKKLEPLYSDYRKLRIMDTQRKFSVLHMDEFIDNLLHEDKVLNISLPRLTKRVVLEDNRDIEPYKSELEEQNLIPTELIEEKVERQRIEEKRMRHRMPSPSSSGDYRRHRDRDYSSHRDRDRSDRRQRHDGHHTSSRHRRAEETSPRHKSSGSYSRALNEEKKPDLPERPAGRHRFSQAFIDSENAIRAKVGLKPLK